MPAEPAVAPPSRLALTCDELAELLPAAAEAGSLGVAARAHLRGCGRCRAEAATYERLRHRLAGLRADRVDPGPDLLDAVLEAVRRRRRRRSQMAYLGAAGGLAAASAGVAGALMSLARARRHRLAG